jgi:glycosyltransferase involved in cell wall biosynthesis
MRIFIDGTYLDSKRGTGMNRYLNNLLKGWASLPNDNKYTVVTRTKVAHPLAADRRFEFVQLAPKLLFNVFVWQNLDIPLFLKSEKFDALFFPTYFAPFWGLNAPVVTLIYDVYYLAHPEWVPFLKYRMLKAGTERAGRVSKGIICGSIYDRDQIVKYVGVKPEAVKIVYGAPAEKFRKMPPTAAFREKYKLGERRIVSCVGILFNRRHQDTVVRAFDELADGRKDLQLLLIGYNATHPNIDYKALIASCRNRDRILHIEYLPEEDMLDMYNSSDLLVYLSSHEGESYPMREALACGVPCLTSPMLHEVSGKAAVYVDDPTSVPAVAEGLEKAMTGQRELAALAAALPRRTWGDIASETLACIEQAAAR